MTDFEIIGQILNQAMQVGTVGNVGHSDGGDIDVLAPKGDGWQLYFTFEKGAGTAKNLTLDEMKASLSEAGITV